MSETITLQTAQAALDDIVRHRAQLVERLHGNASQLEALETDLGPRYLAGDAGVAGELAALKTECNLIEHALTTLDGRQRLADIALKRATAADYRAQAGAKRAEIEKLRAKTSKLLSQLAELEHVEFDCSILNAMRNPAANWLTKETAVTGIPPELTSPIECVALGQDPEPGRMYFKTRSRILNDEAVGLIAKAYELETTVQFEGTPKPQRVATLGTNIELLEQIQAEQPKARTITPGAPDDPYASPQDKLEAFKRKAGLPR
jgi:hypothetical protein